MWGPCWDEAAQAGDAVLWRGYGALLGGPCGQTIGFCRAQWHGLWLAATPWVGTVGVCQAGPRLQWVAKGVSYQPQAWPRQPHGQRSPSVDPQEGPLSLGNRWQGRQRLPQHGCGLAPGVLKSGDLPSCRLSWWPEILLLSRFQ